MTSIHRRGVLLQGAGLALSLTAGLSGLWSGTASTSSPEEITAYRDPSCGCCGAWVEHLARAGFRTKVIEMARVETMKERLGVPASAWSCHTAEIGGYVLEGHVPVAAVRALLATRPPIRGLAVPGMPVGSPGMEAPGMAPETYDVLAFGGTAPSRFMRFRGSERIDG
jgi:hypothetical protein